MSGCRGGTLWQARRQLGDDIENALPDVTAATDEGRSDGRDGAESRRLASRRRAGEALRGHSGRGGAEAGRVGMGAGRDARRSGEAVDAGCRDTPGTRQLQGGSRNAPAPVKITVEPGVSVGWMGQGDGACELASGSQRRAGSPAGTPATTRRL